MISKFSARLVLSIASVFVCSISSASSSSLPTMPPAMPPGFFSPGPGEPSCGTLGCGHYVPPTSTELLATVLLDPGVQLKLLPFSIEHVIAVHGTLVQIYQFTMTSKCNVEARISFAAQGAVIDGMPAVQVGKSSAYGFVDITSSTCP